MANESVTPGPDETPANPVPPSGRGELPTLPIVPAGSGPDLPALEPAFGETAPTFPFLPPRPTRPHLENLSARERGVALPRGLSGMPRNVRMTLVALSVLLLVGCCTLSWSAVSAIIPAPGPPVAAASTAVSGSPAASATASATDQPTATDSGTPSSGGDATPTPSAGPTDTPTPLPPTPTTTPCPNPYCNPWGYNFIAGSLIPNPNPAFCSVFPCVKGFWSESGYVVECTNGLFAHDGNVRKIGVCSKNGLFLRNLYQ